MLWNVQTIIIISVVEFIIIINVAEFTPHKIMHLAVI